MKKQIKIDVFSVFGLMCLVSGVTLFSIPAGLITLGVIILAVSVILEVFDNTNKEAEK